MKKITFFKTLLPLLFMLLGSFGLYAQYPGTGIFNQITAVEEIESGGYYVLYGISGEYTGALNNEFANGRFKATSVVVSGTTVVDPAATAVWKIEGNVADGFTIFNENASVYCEIATNSTSGFSAPAASTHTFTATVNEGNFFLMSNSSTGGLRGISIYQTDFRPYAASAAKTLYLYKLSSSTQPTVVANPYFLATGDLKAVDTYWNSASVSIATPTDGATIYYTTNGDAPTTASTVYTDAFVVTTTTTLKAIAVKTDLDNSEVIEKIITIAPPATAALPYQELFDGNLGDWYAKSVEGDQAWAASSYSSGNYTVFAKISGYSGGNKVNQDWLVSPEVTTSADGYKLTFASAVGYAGPALGLKYSTNYNGIVDPSTATWTDITTSATWPDGVTNFAWFESGDVIVEGTAPVRFAFVYTSTADAAATWEVANVNVANYTKPVVPTLFVSDVTVPQLTAMVGETDTETFNVSGVNLTGNISLALTGEGVAQFTVSTNAIEPVEGTVGETDVTVTFSPATAGTFAATLTLSSAGATNVVLALEGVATAPPVQLTPADVIITEVYGGGGNSGAVLKNDFIELYNSKDVSVSIAGWSLQYYSATGTAASGTNVFVIPEGKFIPAKGYFLVLAAAGQGGTTDIEKPDAVSAIALAGSAGKVVLYTVADAQTVVVDDVTSITGNAAFKDYVPFGTTARPIWGSAMSTNLSSTTSATRLMVGESYSYTQNVGYDFGVAEPTPQNSGLTAVAPQPTTRAIYVSNGMLHFDAVAGESVEVYNSLGQKVVSSVAQDGLNSMSVAARGVVIVKIADQVAKVIL